MSKASEYAARCRKLKDDRLRLLLPRRVGMVTGDTPGGEIAFVDDDGRLVCRLALNATEALALAAWIVETFGEQPTKGE